MYISEFVCGLIVGVLATFGGLVVWSVWLSRKHRNS
jgi:hypothetical protein